MLFTSKKRSRRALDSRNAICPKRTGRTLFSAAALTLAATVAVTVDTAAVFAFTPNGSGRTSLSTGPVPSIIDSNAKDNVVMKISPRQRPRHKARQQVGSISSTVVDNDSIATATAASGHGVSIMTSPILQQQRKGRLSPRNAKNVVIVDDEYILHDNNDKNEQSVKVLFDNDILNSQLLTTDAKRNLKRRRKESSSSALLTRDEERQITYRIRDLRRVVQIRDELLRANENSSFGVSNQEVDDFPTEEDWAKACGMDILSLRKLTNEGQEARSVLVSANAGLVRNIAKRHYYILKQMTMASGGVGTILTLQDMIQEGNLGLMKAAERFDPERGFRFSTYATYWIRQRILQSITDSSRVIRLPVHVTETLRKLNRARKEISAEIGRMPSDAELAQHLNISVEKLRRISDKTRSVVSLESPLPVVGNHRSEVDRRTIGDFIASDAPTPEEDAEHKSLQQDIRAVVNELAEREREVLILRFGLDNGEPMSTSETAARLGITSDRVRYVETRALNKLRNPQRNYKLKDYLGKGDHTSLQEDRQRTLSKSSALNNKHHSSTVKKKTKQKTPLAHEKFWFF